MTVVADDAEQHNRADAVKRLSPIWNLVARAAYCESSASLGPALGIDARIRMDTIRHANGAANLAL